MFDITIRPRFCDTDAQGHINNTVYPVWLLEGREAIVQLVKPDFMQGDDGLALVRQEIDYEAECFFGNDVRVVTRIEHIGNSSIRADQEIWQNGKRCVHAKAILVYFDRKARKSMPLPDDVRARLSSHLETGT